MKTLFKKFWPLLLLLLAALVVGAFFLWRFLFPNAESAVKGYLKASLTYDVDGLLRYGSEYQLVSLAGNGNVPKETLRANLKKYYEQNGFTGKTGKVTFDSARVTVFEPGSATYEKYLSLYGEKADASAVSGIARVTVSAFVDGTLQKEYSVLAVKCGARWYYGFVHFEGAN